MLPHEVARWASWFLGDRAATSPGVVVDSQVDDTSTAAMGPVVGLVAALRPHA